MKYENKRMKIFHTDVAACLLNVIYLYPSPHPIKPTPYNRKYNVLSASLKKTFIRMSDGPETNVFTTGERPIQLTFFCIHVIKQVKLFIF